MTATATTKLLVTASLLTLTIGSIDAGISGDWDLFVIFLIAIGLQSHTAHSSGVPAPGNRHQT